jgi:hypothetical protein
MKNLFRYLRGTVDQCVEFNGDLTTDDRKLQQFANASWADRIPSRYSTGAYVILVAGRPVLWKTKKHTFIALSITEAEFTNLTPIAQFYG